MSGPTTPADIVNRVLDSIGRSDLALGDLEEGTEGAKPALRAYGPALRQLLRSAHWNFARKQANLQLLGDQTGNTPNVGTQVVPPWTYEYALPPDCMKARFVPHNNALSSNNSPQANISLPDTPIMTGLTNAPTNGYRLIPARFLVATDFNYPVQIGNVQTEWWGASETGPAQRTVVLTNVKNASLVYTALMIYPNEWDSLFEEAFVQLLASRLALTLARDPKMGLALRAQAIVAAKNAITEARIADGNEGVPTADISVDWMRVRNAGGGWWWGRGGYVGAGGDGPGVFGYGYDQIGVGDGAVF